MIVFGRAVTHQRIRSHDHFPPMQRHFTLSVHMPVSGESECIYTGGQGIVSASSSTRRPLALYALTFLLLFLSLGAFVGGISMLLDPKNALGMPASMLRAHSPFANFIIPGIILYSLFGVGSLIVFFALWVRLEIGVLRSIEDRVHEHWSWAGAVFIGVAQMIW